MTRFTLALDGDCQGEPPHIYVIDHVAGGQFAEIFLEPIPFVDEPDSFEDEHWDFPEVAKQTVRLMNAYDSR